MTNTIETRYALVTLPDVAGEESDELVSQLDEYAATITAGASVEHLTPETLPARYIERPGMFWTLTHIADWEGGTTIYTSRAALVAQVESDARDAAERAGDDYDSTTIPTVELVNGILTDVDVKICDAGIDTLADYIGEHGWKVHHYTIESHTWPTPAELDADAQVSA